MIVSTFGLLFALLLLYQPLLAEQLRFDSASDWRRWQLPLGAVELMADGSIEPVRARKNINAALNAVALGGGVHHVGSNARDASSVLDGDIHTGWAPIPGSDPGDWFIEIDLGRSVSAKSVTLVFAEDAPPFELFELMLSSGEPQLDVVAQPIEGTLVYRMLERVKENARHRVVYAPGESLEITPIRYVRLHNFKEIADARLVEIEVEGVGDNLVLGLQERGGGIDVVLDVLAEAETVALNNATSLVDGDIFNRWRNVRDTRAPYTVIGHITLDLGAVYLVDFVRLISGVAVRGGRSAQLERARTGAIGPRGFSFKAYEVLTSDGSLAPDGTRIWTRHFSGERSNESQRKGLADHFFSALPSRFVRIGWTIWDATCAAALPAGASRYVCLASGSLEEIQIFGTGYPLEATLRSPLIDLGGDKSLSSMEWGGDLPPGTGVEVRSRTGNEVVEEHTYRDKNGKKITQRKWEKTPPTLRGSIDSTRIAGTDWSPWSQSYGFSGEAFHSPSPRRYMELEVRLVSKDPQATATLDWLAVNFTEPLAARVVGEIYPTEVPPGHLAQFSYFLKPDATPSGFDRIRIEATTVPQFEAAFVNGERVDVVSESLDKGFRVSFPSRIRSRQLVELRFSSPIYLQATRFDAFLEDSRNIQVRQLVDAGDATDGVESNTNVVNLPLNRDLLLNADFSTRVLTPNGDSINDEIVVLVDVVNVLAPRPLRLRLYDLAGRQLTERRRDVQAGPQQLSWDGRDDYGQSVPPGLYLLELHIGGDAGAQRVRRVVSVVY